MWKPIVITGLLVLGGCSMAEGAKQSFADTTMELSETGLRDARWIVCEGAQVGAVRREYGTSKARADLYNDFCKSGAGAVITGAE